MGYHRHLLELAYGQTIPLFVERFARAIEQYETPLGSIEAWVDDEHKHVVVRIDSLNAQWIYSLQNCVSYYELSARPNVIEHAYLVARSMFEEILLECLLNKDNMKA